MNPEDRLTVVIIDDALNEESPHGRTIKRIANGLSAFNIDVFTIASIEDARSAYANLPDVDCILINWNIGGKKSKNHDDAKQLIHEIRDRNEDIPIFLMAEPASEAPSALNVETVREVNEYIYIMDDTPEFIAGRITAAANRYKERLLPPFFGALVKFSKDFEYSWHTPGHAGGTAFRKSPSGRLFHKFFGEQLFRSDLSISVGELGSLLDHSGPLGEAERYAAKVFGADMTYFVTNGTSTANKIVFFGRVAKDDIVLVDRNCHKSAEHALTMTHSYAIFMIPTRNRYGIIGPIPPSEMTQKAIKAKIDAGPLTRDMENKKPVHAIVTNSTYDGLCYRATEVEDLLGKSVDSIHFDEAWYAYARFNPLYRERFAMRDGDKNPKGPTVFATQSTHKLLAALSQASMVHVRNGRVLIEHSRFNEGFMMHSSTSPLYTIMASLDVSSKMMEGAAGRVLTTESIEEAIRFRRTMARIYREICGTGKLKDWWFGMWQPDSVTDPKVKKKVHFADAQLETLRDNPSAWVLHPGEPWHGFSDLPDGFCMLDPIKVTVTMPGVNDDGTLGSWGIPAAVVVKFLDTRGIVNEKSGDYIILFLFSMGNTKGKWGTLISELFEFKRHYDEGTPLEEIFPDLTTAYHERYGGMTLKSLTDEMHAFKKEHRMCELLEEAYATLPEPAITYAEAYKKLVRGEVEHVPVSRAGNRIVATGIYPYPPGIPLFAPGERTGRRNGPLLGYLKSLQDFDNRFPGFEHDTHGVENCKGEYMMYCIKEEKR
ncbi:MAG TPA: Orn/Lys/Arg decarboxylase N-terminal domain-containing protein [Methanoregulaceae archaeon]|nr:Orn/Lys/Arg decarboxylase N-terminal domain-containing protein [Methanoregulaceae archaeon]